MMNTKPKHDPAPWRLCRDQSGWYIVPVEGKITLAGFEWAYDFGRCRHDDSSRRIFAAARAAIAKAEGAPAPAADGEDKA